MGIGEAESVVVAKLQSGDGGEKIENGMWVFTILITLFSHIGGRSVLFLMLPSRLPMDMANSHFANLHRRVSKCAIPVCHGNGAINLVNYNPFSRFALALGM